LIDILEGCTPPKDIFSASIKNGIEKNGYFSDEVANSLIFFFMQSPYLKKNISDISFIISPLTIIEEDKLAISYSDGSFKKTTNQASYGCVRLLNESDSGLVDDFTGKKFEYQELSGVIENGTNNIGELTGIKVVIENFSDSKFQLIISDSQYSIKCFREWFYTWRKNNWKTYAKKDILNKDLIIGISELLENSKKCVFFKWVKGHNSNSFNEVCDKLAKEAF
jgi:ribonuclease HI